MIQQVIALNEHLAPYLGGDHSQLAEKLLKARQWALACMNALGDNSVQAVEYGVPLAADFATVVVHVDNAGIGRGPPGDLVHVPGRT
jgi:hypothetical protein